MPNPAELLMNGRLKSLLDEFSSKYDAVIIDTPPAITENIRAVVQAADLVVIPTRPSPHDLRAVGATVDLVESARKPMVFVVNGAASRAKINGTRVKCELLRPMISMTSPIISSIAGGQRQNTRERSA